MLSEEIKSWERWNRVWTLHIAAAARECDRRLRESWTHHDSCSHLSKPELYGVPADLRRGLKPPEYQYRLTPLRGKLHARKVIALSGLQPAAAASGPFVDEGGGSVTQSDVRKPGFCLGFCGECGEYWTHMRGCMGGLTGAVRVTLQPVAAASGPFVVEGGGNVTRGM